MGCRLACLDKWVEMMLKIIVAVLGIIAGIITVWQKWWQPIAERVFNSARDAEPNLYWKLGHYGGAKGNGVRINLQNQGKTDAHDLAIYLSWEALTCFEIATLRLWLEMTRCALGSLRGAQAPWQSQCRGGLYGPRHVCPFL